MIPRPINRTPVTRITRGDTGQRRLESVATEFALLAQRRSRLTQKLELLGQQYHVAAATLSKLQARMAWLARHMDALEPRPRETDTAAFEQLPASARAFKTVPMTMAISGGGPRSTPRDMPRDMSRDMSRDMPRDMPRDMQMPAVNPASLPAIGRRWLAARPGFHAPAKLPAAPFSGKWRS